MVFNFNRYYDKYCLATKEIRLADDDGLRCGLKQKENVLRLIERRSSTSIAWRGVSVRSSSAGLPKTTNFSKVHPYPYVKPLWTLEELQKYNLLYESLLGFDDRDLVERHDKFGGIQRLKIRSHTQRNGAKP